LRHPSNRTRLSGSREEKGTVARDAVNLAYLGLRATLGRARVRHDDPQTMIVVARRTD
jgi:hypothetical protein